MIMAILGGAVITPWMAGVITAKESAFFALAPMLDFTWDANLRTSSGALRSSFFIHAICFAVMFVYDVVFRSSKTSDENSRSEGSGSASADNIHVYKRD